MWKYVTRPPFLWNLYVFILQFLNWCMCVCVYRFWFSLCSTHLPQIDEASGLPAVLRSRRRLGLAGHHQHGSAGAQVRHTKTSWTPGDVSHRLEFLLHIVCVQCASLTFCSDQALVLEAPDLWWCLYLCALFCKCLNNHHCIAPCFPSYFRKVKGLHVNFAPPSKPGLPMALSILLGRRFPKLFGFTDMDIQRLYPCMEKLVVETIKESGYMHIQATKPDTVGKDRGPVSTVL